MKQDEDMAAFVARFTPMAHARVNTFLSHAPRVHLYELRRDLVQAALYGIIQAYTTFDALRGVPIASYVAMKIDYAIRDEFDRFSPAQSRALAQYGRVQHDMSTLERLYKRQVTKSELADFLSVSDKELSDVFNSIATPVELKDDGLTNTNPSIESDIISRELSEKLAESLSRLDSREREVLHLYFVEGQSAVQIAARLGLCRQRIYQIMSAALETVKMELIRHGYVQDSRHTSA